MGFSVLVFKIADPQGDPRKLSQAVIQITELLGLFQAEMARVLHLQCGDIGQLSNGQSCLQPDTKAWEQALLFVKFYHLLYTKFNGDGVAMRHWLRVEHETLAATPHQLIIDDDHLLKVIEHLNNG